VLGELEDAAFLELRDGLHEPCGLFRQSVEGGSASHAR
jgi:hypothetical protein